MRKGLRNQFKALLGLRKPGTLSPQADCHFFCCTPSKLQQVKPGRMIFG